MTVLEQMIVCARNRQLVARHELRDREIEARATRDLDDALDDWLAVHGARL